MNFSGKFVLRIPPDLHKKLTYLAKKNGVSLNILCMRLIKSGLQKREDFIQAFPSLEPTMECLRSHFKEEIEGLLLFGSQITGKATEGSDVDLAIVLSQNISLNRSLYRWWDETFPDEKIINPHFIHLPSSPLEASSLWLEIASASHLLWERGNKIHLFLKRVQSSIQQNESRRYWSHGTPYWIKSDEESRTGH